MFHEHVQHVLLRSLAEIGIAVGVTGMRQAKLVGDVHRWQADREPFGVN